MKRITRILVFVFALAMLVCCVPTELVASASNYNWAAAWGTPAVESGIVLGESDSGLHLQDYIPAGTTIRTVVTPTIGGTKIRLKFSNYYSPKAVTFNEVTVAQTGETDDVVDENTITQVTFNGGQKSVKIAAGSEIYSDEITFPVTALKKISISTYYKNTTYMYTTGMYNGVSYMASSLGNRTHKEDMTAFASRLTFTSSSITYYTIPFLTRLDIYSKDAYSVVLLGDSTLTNEIPLMLAKKLHANGITNVGFVMSGIIGNALTRDGTGLLGKVYGESTLERANRDAFDVAGVKYVIIKVGENDILHPMLKSNEGKLAQTTPAQVIQGYRQLAQLAYGKGINLYLCTRTPYKGYERAFLGSKDLTWTQKGENMFLEINSWVENNCTSFNYAGHIDLDAVRDPSDPAKLYDHMTTDGIHFSEYGQIAVVDLIPEVAYGVNRELKDYADILNIDPYVAPVVESTTKAPSNNNNNSNNGNNNNNSNNSEPTTNNNGGSPNVITPAEPTTNQNLAPGIIVTPETTTMPNANQIFVDDALDNDTVLGAVSDVDPTAARQLAGFAILATVAMAIIAVSAVMLIKMRPGASSGSLARGGKGRATQKKRV